MITQDDVQKIARLSRLALRDGEAEAFGTQLNSILDYVEQLNALDTSAVEPTSHVIPLQNVVREDVVRESLPREAALQNAPDATELFYRVPKIIE
ncbi:MAG TPA: Asp-tRNA(Asn)/Glu-tRNA(Gln) amidotransferase subunit GatC [Dissulfurispiraceae bacterium]|nr:Asp-tRNA(Asn)/Glu-tRNA(Gln) amidotransferase subunit GatC [Dissulfurispiraceae bacterium]